MNLDQGANLIDIPGLLRRRGKLIAIIAGSVILVTFWVAMALPNLYMSSAVILVEPQSVDEKLVESGVREGDLNARLDLMTAEILSRARLSKIISEMNLYEDERDDLQRFEVVDLMRSYIDVQPVMSDLQAQQQRGKAPVFSTFRIVYRNESAQVAKEVAQRVANDYINANIDSRTQVTAKSLDFMADQIKSLSESLATVENQIAKAKAENTGRLPEEFEANQRMLQFAMGDLRDAQRIHDAAESDAAYWKNQALTALSMSSPNDQTSPAYRLRSLEIELGSLRARGFTEKHPDVVRVQSEMAIVKQQITADGKVDEDGPPRTFGEQNARAEQRRAELRAKASAQDIERLRNNVTDLEARLAATSAVAERLDALNRQYEHLYRSYQDFSGRLQQAGVQADLERRQLGEKFRILESAVVAPEPSSPNRILLLTLGAMLGLALGAGIGLIAEMSDSSLHTSLDLQKALGIPVLASVPRIVLESDRVARSRRILRETVAAAGVVLFVMVGGVVTYYIVNHDSATTTTVDDTQQEEPASAGIQPGTGRG